MNATSSTADLILSGGKIWLGQGLGFAEAIAFEGGKVKATGTTDEITRLQTSDTRMIDLAG